MFGTHRSRQWRRHSPRLVAVLGATLVLASGVSVATAARSGDFRDEFVSLDASRWVTISRPAGLGRVEPVNVGVADGQLGVRLPGGRLDGGDCAPQVSTGSARTGRHSRPRTHPHRSLRSTSTAHRTSSERSTSSSGTTPAVESCSRPTPTAGRRTRSPSCSRSTPEPPSRSTRSTTVAGPCGSWSTERSCSSSRVG
jgi:hypothetical protein